MTVQSILGAAVSMWINAPPSTRYAWGTVAQESVTPAGATTPAFIFHRSGARPRAVIYALLGIPIPTKSDSHLTRVDFDEDLDGVLDYRVCRASLPGQPDAHPQSSVVRCFGYNWQAVTVFTWDSSALVWRQVEVEAAHLIVQRCYRILFPSPEALSGPELDSFDALLEKVERARAAATSAQERQHLAAAANYLASALAGIESCRPPEETNHQLARALQELQHAHR